MAITPVRDIQFEQFEVAQQEGDAYWSLTATITYPSDAVSFTPATVLELAVRGELFYFYVTRIGISKRAEADVTAEIAGVGLPADLEPPRRRALTKTWDQPMLASAIVAELLEQRVVEWTLVDWLIPPYRLAAENASPLAVALDVIEAAGGVLESYPTGELYVRPRFPVKAADYANVEPDVEFDEGENVYHVDDVTDLVEYINWVRVRSGDDSIGDSVEFEFDENTELIGTLFVYPSPWRPVTLEHTGPANVTLDAVGVVEREVEEELVAIEEGEGSTKYPIVAISRIRWQAVNLQGLFHEPYSRTVNASHPTLKYSLAYVTYTTKSIHYRTSSPVTQEVQFLVVDDTGGS